MKISFQTKTKTEVDQQTKAIQNYHGANLYKTNGLHGC